MARPTGYTQDPSGGVNVSFDNGETLLMDPRHPAVASALSTLPEPQPIAAGTPDDIARSLRVDNAPGPVGYTEPAMPASRSAFAVTPTPVASDVRVMPGFEIGHGPVAATTPMSAPESTSIPLSQIDAGHTGVDPRKLGSDAKYLAYGTNTGKPISPATEGNTIDPSKRVMIGGQGGVGAGAIGPGDFRIIPGSPGRFVKGGRTPQSWQVTKEEGLPVPEEAKAALAKADEDAALAGRLQQDAATERADVESLAAGHETWRKRLYNEETNRIEALRKVKEDEAIQRYDAAKVVDPNRLWHDAGAGEKFLARLGVAAGAFLQGSGMTANNIVLDQINQEIERDTQAQLQNLQSADADIKRMYGQWDREDQRRMAGEAAKFDAAKSQVEEWMSGVKSKEAQARGLELAAKLGQESANRKIELARLEAGKTVTAQHDVQTPDRVVGGSAARVDASGAIRKYFENGGSAEELQKAVQAGTTAGLSKDAAAAAFLQGQSASSGTGGGTAPLSEKDQAAAVSYSKALAESKAPDFNAAAAQLREMASGSSPDDRVPGFSMGANIAKAVMPAGTHEWVTSDRGYANQQRMSWIQTLLGQVISGASVSPSQEAAIIKVTSGRGSAKDFETAAATLEQTAKTRAEAAASGYKPSVVSAVHARQSALQPKVAFDSAARQEKAK